MLLGGTYEDGMKMTRRELTVMTIILGTKRRGRYDLKRNRWVELPVVW